jgi:hypothetical protein
MGYFLLDRYGDARVPEGYVVIDDEVAFLTHATEEGYWLIRGSRLCEWAETFFTGREVGWQEALSPSREIQKAIPGLNSEQAEELFAKLEAQFDALPRPLTPEGIAQALYPHYIWQAQPSLDHAARWLLWLDQRHDLKDAERPLIQAIQQRWARECLEELRAIYEVAEPEVAQDRLEEWLGITAETCGYPEPFPAEVPQQWCERAAEAWRSHLIETQGTFVISLLERHLPTALRQVAGQVTHSYFVHNPAHLTEEYLNKLAKVVSVTQWEQLRRLLRPPEPSEVPSSPADVHKWFREEYLPFREWQRTTGDREAHRCILNAGRSFAQWYLDSYPRVAIADDLSSLSFLRVRALRQEKTRFVSLLVVLDGLYHGDAQRLLVALQGKTKRLTLQRDDLVFAPIPTITQFAKEALVKGVLPKDSAEVSSVGMDISESKSPLKQLEASSPGDIFIWRIQEPDRTYHSRNSYETLQEEVEGQLNTVAGKIADIINQLPNQIALRVILTSDHGRLLGTSQRSVPVPHDMQAHGRAAWGRVQREYPASGYVLDDNLVYLSGERFGLVGDVAIVLDENAFLTNDCKQGSERYTHGGLFPEEVLVPWIELERDAMPIQEVISRVQVRIMGKGRAGQPATLHIRIINNCDTPLILNSIRLSIGKRQSVSFDLNEEISAIAEFQHDVELSSWPSGDEAQRTTASAVVTCQPSGECFEMQAAVDIESEALYQRSISLQDDLGS